MHLTHWRIGVVTDTRISPGGPRVAPAQPMGRNFRDNPRKRLTDCIASSGRATTTVAISAGTFSPNCKGRISLPVDELLLVWLLPEVVS